MDGWVVLEERAGSLRIRVYNRDGSVAEVSGNALRAGAFVVSRERDADEIVFETWGGARRVWKEGELWWVLLREGEPLVYELPPPEGAQAAFFTTFPKNPHIVLLVSSLPERIPWSGLLEELLRGHRFPWGVNLELVQPVLPQHVRARVYERGVGETGSCGSGALAIAVVLEHLGRASFPLRVEFPGGILRIRREGRAYALGGRVRAI